MKKTKEILDQFGLKKTEIRLKILAFLQNSNKAISQPDLEKEFVKSADRVTLYRILSAFEQKGIIHKIIDLGGVARYAVCNHDVCSENHHHDNHVHFSCSSCGDVLCIESIPIPKIELPKDLIQNKITLSIEGICRKCNK